MSDVGWDQEDCQANAKVEIDVNCDAGILDKKIESLKLDQHLSTVRVYFPAYQRALKHCHEKVIDRISDLLNSNTNIKNLKVENEAYCKPSISAHVLEMLLTNGDAGDNLEYLWYDFNGLSTSEADTLQRYMKTNRNLRRLRIHVERGPASLQLVSCLSGTKITELCLDVWPYRGMGELGAVLGQCSSILSLKIVVRFYFTETQSFLRGATELRCLTRFEIDLRKGKATSEEIIDTISSLVVQQDALAHFDLAADDSVVCMESWKGLGLALCSVKSVSIRIRSQDALLALVLPHLQACESLALSYWHFTGTFQPIGEIASGLPNLRVVSISHVRDSRMVDDVLEMIKSSKTITSVLINTASPFVHGRVDSSCILNRVFGTNLVGFEPTELWSRVLSKVSDGSARATLLYRLLREKPELIVGSSSSWSASPAYSSSEF